MGTTPWGIGIIRYVHSGLDEGTTSDAVVVGVGVLDRIPRILYQARWREQCATLVAAENCHAGVIALLLYSACHSYDIA